MTRLLFLCCAMLITCRMYGASIVGQVVDAKDGLPLTGVNVRTEDALRGSVSDERGNYSFSLPQGTYTLIVSMIGYTPLREKVVVTGDRVLNFRLVEETLMLSQVEVTAERRARLERVETGVQKLTPATISTIPALFGEVDLIKAIQMLPGVQPASEGTSSYNVRGGAPSQNLVALDQATVYNATHLLGFFSVFNNDVIEDVTLYKGDMPTGTGGRLSSLLEVSSKEGSEKPFSLVGGVSPIASRLLVGGQVLNGDLSGYIAGRRTYADLFLKLAPDKTLRDNRLYFYDLNGAISWRINEKHRITLSAYTGEDVFGSSFGGMRFGNTTGTLQWRATLSPILSSQVWLTRSLYRYEFGSETAGIRINWKAAVSDWSIKNQWTWTPNEQHFVRFGISSTLYDAKPGDAFTQQEGQRRIEISTAPRKALGAALFAEDNYKITPKLTLRYGLRYNAFFNIGPEVVYNYNENHQFVDSTVHGAGQFFHHYGGLEPRIGMVYAPAEENSIKWSICRNEQYMHLISTSMVGSPLDFWIPSGPTIKQLTAWQYSAGYMHNLDNGMWELTGEVYYKDITHLIDYRDHPTILLNEHIESEIRSGHGYSYGIELMARKTSGKLTGWISYTFSHAYQQVEGANGGRWYRSPSDRPHNVNVVVNYAFSPRFSVSANWIYVSGQPMTFPEGRMMIGGESVPIYGNRNTYRMADYHRLDLGATWQLNRQKTDRWQHELGFSIYNAYSRKNVWYINFTEDPKGSGVMHAEMLYLFPIIPSVSYNFKF